MVGILAKRSRVAGFASPAVNFRLHALIVKIRIEWPGRPPARALELYVGRAVGTGPGSPIGPTRRFESLRPGPASQYAPTPAVNHM